VGLQPVKALVVYVSINQQASIVRVTPPIFHMMIRVQSKQIFSHLYSSFSISMIFHNYDINEPDDKSTLAKYHPSLPRDHASECNQTQVMESPESSIIINLLLHIPMKWPR